MCKTRNAIWKKWQLAVGLAASTKCALARTDWQLDNTFPTWLLLREPGLLEARSEYRILWCPYHFRNFSPSITASQLILAFNMLYINECYILQFHSIPASMIGRQYQTGCRPEEVHEKYFYLEKDTDFFVLFCFYFLTEAIHFYFIF